MEKTISRIAKGVGISLITTVILLIIFATILTYTEVSETIINPVIIIITALSILMGSSIGNMKIKKNGLLNGALIGRKLYSYNILNIKYFKLELWITSTKYYYDCRWNGVWSFGRNNRS